MIHELAIIASAWADRKNTVWRDACDRVAMGFICQNPLSDRRVELITKYRELCHAEEYSNARHRSE